MRRRTARNSLPLQKPVVNRPRLRGVARAVYEGAAVAEREHRRVRLRADGREVLLVAWLNEIIYLVCDGVFLPASVRLTELTGSSLEAMLAGETPDGSRHRLAREVKAATYHDLEVSETDGLWRGRVLFDV